MELCGPNIDEPTWWYDVPPSIAQMASAEPSAELQRGEQRSGQVLPPFLQQEEMAIVGVLVNTAGVDIDSLDCSCRYTASFVKLVVMLQHLDTECKSLTELVDEKGLLYQVFAPCAWFAVDAS